MSRTPAAALARLKIIYPRWTIARYGNGTIRAVREGGPVLIAAIPSELEELLEEAER